MRYKEDWEMTKKRLLAWWEREIVDRVVIQVRAPRPEARKVVPPANLIQRWTDVDYVLDAAEERMRLTYYGGDAFPAYWPNLGPDIFAAFLGCDLEFGEHTSWSVPLVREWDELKGVVFDKRNEWWQLCQRMLEEGGQRFAGDAVLGFTDIHGGGDGVAALRDPQMLALDMIDHPVEVQRAMSLVEDVWFQVYEAELEVIRRYSEGATTWMNLWHPGRWYPVSCDFICMISREMFHEFILPELLAEINYLDRSIFHLDGPRALIHLDDLLAIEKVDAIQWVPGANSGPIAQWFPILKKIQAAGKGLQLHIEATELEGVLAELSPRGLCISTAAESIEQAEAIIKRAAQLTRAR